MQCFVQHQSTSSGKWSHVGMYCTPQIDKDGTPLQPVVDYIRSIEYNTFRALGDILASVLQETEFHVKIVTDLANFLKGSKVEDNKILVVRHSFTVHQH